MARNQIEVDILKIVEEADRTLNKPAFSALLAGMDESVLRTQYPWLCTWKELGKPSKGLPRLYAVMKYAK